MKGSSLPWLPPRGFRFRVVALARAGKIITAPAAELDIRTGALHNRVVEDQIERGEPPGLTTYETTKLLGKDRPAQKGSSGDRRRTPGQSVLSVAGREQP